MEQQQDQQIGIDEEEEKENNQMEMVSEEPIDEERNEPANSPSPDNALEGEDMPAEMEEEEKVNQNQPNEEISVEDEAEDNEAISEEVGEREANEQANPTSEPHQNEAINEEKPEQANRPVQEHQAQVQVQPNQPHPEPPREVEHAEEPVQTQNQQQQLEEGEEEGEEEPQKEVVEQGENVREDDLKSAKQVEAQANAAQLAILQKKKAEENIAYTNNLERLVESLNASLTKSRNQEAVLRKKSIALESQLATMKTSFFKFKQGKLELQAEKAKLAREKDILTRENADFKAKLTEIQKIGNILVLQSTIEELKLLTGVQKDEIEHLKTVNTQQTHSYYQQQFNLLESYQNELNSFREQSDALSSKLEQSENEKAQIFNAKLAVQNDNASLRQTINALENDKVALRNEIAGWQKKWESFEDERAEFKRTRELDQKVSQYESERFMGEDNDLQIIPTLSDKEEKNLLLKEYLKLEALYEDSKTKQEQAETRLKRVLRDSKIQQANAIRKKDYQDLLSRYRKAKTCLQGAFTRLKNLERVESCPKEIRQEVNELLEGNESRLCQTIIKKTNQQYQLVSDKINQMELTDQIITLKKQNAKYKQKQARLEKELKNNEKILYLMNDQLEARKKIADEKSKTIERLINAGYHHKNSHYEERIAQLQRQVRTHTETLQVLEIKSVLLIKENESYLHQINHWKSLYNSIKDQLSSKIAISLTESEKPIIQTRMETESHYYCKECEKRNLELANTPQRFSQCVQTQNNYDLHYKEIKQSLLCLKKINKEVETIPDSHQKTIRLISEFKDKYEKNIEKYNAKLLELKKEKADNQSWRNRTRQEIQNEFQDIRDLISNNRLAMALRQAKSLIDYLENEQKGQEEEENGKEEMQEENNNEPEQK